MKDRQEYDALEMNTSGNERKPNYGKMFTLCRMKNGNHLVCIGPHWYISIVGMGLIGVAGWFMGKTLFPMVPGWVKLTYAIAFGFTMLTYFTLFLSDPGMVPRYDDEEEEDIENKDRRYCKKCPGKGRYKEWHCSDCDVCIKGFDHHCVWIGKCIGKNNLVLFYIFTGSIMVFFIFVMILAALSGQHIPNRY